VTGRVAVEVDFADGGIRCGGWGGDLRLSDIGQGRPCP
jgi:hypothetical protein